MITCILSPFFVTVIKHLDKNQLKVERSYFRLQVLVQHWEKSDQELKHELWRNTNCWLLSTLYNALFSHRLILSLLSLWIEILVMVPYPVGWTLQNIIKRKIIQMWSHRLIKSLKFSKGDYSLRQLDTRLCQVDNKVNKDVIIRDQ